MESKEKIDKPMTAEEGAALEVALDQFHEDLEVLWDPSMNAIYFFLRGKQVGVAGSVIETGMVFKNIVREMW